MFGKPGAGKGTLTTRLAAKYDILTLSTGDLLRQHIADRTEVGLKAEEIVARGGLLPDEMVLKVVTSKLDALQHRVRFFNPISHASLTLIAALDSRWLSSNPCSRRASGRPP
jgi:adenylate kinase family enzyme